MLYFARRAAHRKPSFPFGVLLRCFICFPVPYRIGESRFTHVGREVTASRPSGAPQLLQVGFLCNVRVCKVVSCLRERYSLRRFLL